MVFGTGSAGKTSLVNALLGREVGKTRSDHGDDPARGEPYVHRRGGRGCGLSSPTRPASRRSGPGAKPASSEARELAARADLLVFVLDHDLIRTEFEPLAALVRQGKRSIVVLNKTDRLQPRRIARRSWRSCVSGCAGWSLPTTSSPALPRRGRSPCACRAGRHGRNPAGSPAAGARRPARPHRPRPPARGGYAARGQSAACAPIS